MKARPLTVSVTLAVAGCLSLLLPSLVGQRVFHGTDLLERHAPWAETPPDGVTITNPLVMDTVDAVMPTKVAVAERLHDGDIVPAWEPHSLGGSPLLSLPHHGLLSPFSVPYWLLPASYAPGFVKLVELAVAIGFCFLFLRSLGLGRPAGVLGGLIFAFSGFQVAWTNWPQARIGALIPALFWAVNRAIDRRTLRSLAPIAAVVAVMWLEGFPAIVGYALLGAALFTLVRLFSLEPSNRIRAAGAALTGVVLGTALAAVQLIPFAQWISTMDLSSREQNPGAILARRTLATLGVPNAFGNPVDGLYYGPADYLIYGPVNWVENQAFLGLAALGLLAVAAAYGYKVLAPGVRIFLWAGVAVCGVLIYVGGPILALAQQIPLFGISHVGRLRSLFLFLLAVLAAAGFDALTRLAPSGFARKRVLLLIATGGLIVAVVGSGLVRAYEMADEAGHVEYFKGVATTSAVVVGVVAALLAMAFWSKGRRLAIFLIPLVVAFESFSFAVSWWPQTDPDVFYPVSDAHEFLAEKIGGERMVVTGQTMLPNTNVLYGIRSVTGHDFHPPEWADLLRAVDPDAFRLSPTYSSIAHAASLMASPVLDRLAARFVVTDPRQPIFGLPERRLTPSETLELPDGWQRDFPYEDGIRALEFHLTNGYSYQTGTEPGVLRVELLDEAGETVGSSQRRLVSPLPPGPVQVAVVAPVARSAKRFRVRYQGGTPLNLGAADGSPIVGVVKADDDLRVVFAGGAVIYERLSAMERIRWASRPLVLEEAPVRLEALRENLGSDVVLLSEASGIPVTTPGAATLTVIEDSPDRIIIDVEASGSGYVAVMDSLAGNWAAKLDDRQVPIVRADHAGAAIAVPAGHHRLDLRPNPPGWVPGLAITIISLAAVTILFIRPRPMSTRPDPSDGKGSI